ncbi:hypothetical protein ACFE04_027283 [Oxalis oulophora]
MELNNNEFPEKSENRRKIDCFPQSDDDNDDDSIVNPNYKENATKVVVGVGAREGSLYSDYTCNVRNSLAWDSAFFTSPGVLDPEELFGTLNFCDMETSIGLPEPEMKNRMSDSGVRKSLAWDQAFFTSAGVLNPEELSLINKGFPKSEMQQLAIIKEELQKSGESSSTAASSDLSLSSLELDLFDDMRASVHKNSKPPGVLAFESRMRMATASKKLDTSSKTRMRQVPPSRIQGANTHESQKIKKGASICPQKQASGSEASKDASGQSFRGTPPFTRSLRSSNESPGFRFSSSDPAKYLRRKKDPRLASSVSGTPLRKIAGTRSKLVNSSPSHLLSTPRSCSRSPASSIYTSSSGSSNCRTHRSQNSAMKLNLTPSKGFCCDTLTTPSPVTSKTLSNNKPSNLRMPSPKIGYFDVENNVMSLPYRGLKFQSGVRKAEIRTSKVDGSANQTRHSKLGSSPDEVRVEAKSRKRREDESTKRDMKKKISRISDSTEKHEDNHYLFRPSISGFRDEVDDLSRHIAAIDLEKDLVGFSPWERG